MAVDPVAVVEQDKENAAAPSVFDAFDPSGAAAAAAAEDDARLAKPPLDVALVQGLFAKA